MAWSSPRTWVTGETVTAAHMNQEVRDNLDAGFPDAVSAVSYTPTLQASTTNPLDMTVTGRRWRGGPLQRVWARFVFTRTDHGGSGTFFVTLPVSASGLTTGSLNGQAIGSARLHDSSTGANRANAVVLLRTADTVSFVVENSSAVTDSNPFTWDTNDVLTFEAEYPVA